VLTSVKRVARGSPLESRPTEQGSGRCTLSARGQETPYSRLPRAPKGRAGRLRDGYSPLARRCGAPQGRRPPSHTVGRCGVLGLDPAGGPSAYELLAVDGSNPSDIVSYRRAYAIPTGWVGRWEDDLSHSNVGSSSSRSSTRSRGSSAECVGDQPQLEFYGESSYRRVPDLDSPAFADTRCPA
jgi:hypothetical protein